jgi:hypothetical protein
VLTLYHNDRSIAIEHNPLYVQQKSAQRKHLSMEQKKRKSRFASEADAPLESEAPAGKRVATEAARDPPAASQGIDVNAAAARAAEISRQLHVHSAIAYLQFS